MNNSPNPLAGKRILVTRAREQAGELETLLTQHGAIPVWVPLIEFRATIDQAMVDQVDGITAQLNELDWIVFTSSNAINFFFALVQARLPETIKIACVGPKTQQTLQVYGYNADFVPTRFTSKDLANELGARPGDRILYPSPKDANPELVQSLQAAGAICSQVAVYETFPVKLSVSDVNTLKSELDAVTFTSPSVVSSYCDQVPDYKSVLARSTVTCIGPMTAARASKLGIAVDVVPSKHTGEGMVAALLEHFEKLEQEKQ